MAPQADDLQGVGHVPLRVRRVRWAGAERTRADFLARLSQPLLGAETLSELAAAASSLAARAAHLEIFHDAPRFVIGADSERGGVVVEGKLPQPHPGTGQEVTGSGGAAREETHRIADSQAEVVDVVAEVREKRMRMRVGAEVQPGSGDVGLGAGAALYNVLGRGEVLEVRGSAGPSSSAPVSVSVRKPWLPSVARPPAARALREGTLEVAAGTSSSTGGEGGPWTAAVHGGTLSASVLIGRLGVGRPTLLDSATLGVRYVAEVRNLCVPHPYGEDSLLGRKSDVGSELRSEAGLSLRSALRLSATSSSLDDPVLPLSGSRLSASVEAAGLGGDARYVRSELAMLKAASVGVLGLQAGLRLGHVFGPPGGTTVLDRLHAGGPLSVRGFGARTLGPRDALGCALGGTRLAECALLASLPITSASFARAHVFGSACALWDASGRPFASASAGAGIAVRMGDARLEANVALPLLVQPGPSVSPLRTVCIGLGLDYL